MRHNLTEKGVAALKPQATRKEYFDSHVRGLAVRVSSTASPNPVKTWILHFRFEGRQERFTIGRFPLIGVADARKVAYDLRSQIAKGVNPAAAKAEKHAAALAAPTFKDVAALYMADHARIHKRERSWREDQRILDRVMPVLGDRKVADIKRLEVIDLLKA